MAVSACRESVLPENPFHFLILGSVCLAVGLVLMHLLYWGFKRLKRSLSDPCPVNSESSWTIEQINDLHKSGRLTDKQYRSMRDAVIRGAERPAKGNRARR